MSDVELLDDMGRWFTACLGCLAGRREYQKKRYLVEVARTKEEVLSIYSNYVSRLRDRTAVACLFVCPSDSSESKGVLPQITRLSTLFECLSATSAKDLLNGGALNINLKLVCPVTNVEVLFSDFDAVAFCPEADDPSDDLYDPLMSAPVPSVNLNSDLYSFAMFTRDMSLQKYRREVFDLSEVERLNLYGSVTSGWQKIAERTIEAYIELTDVRKCPVFMPSDKSHWFANHQDPAFAETSKDLYRHDMPVLYAPKIICQWEMFFQTGKMPVYDQIAEAGEVTSPELEIHHE